jgi:hypothetical protein
MESVVAPLFTESYLNWLTAVSKTPKLIYLFPSSGFLVLAELGFFLPESAAPRKASQSA